VIGFHGRAAISLPQQLYQHRPICPHQLALEDLTARPKHSTHCGIAASVRPLQLTIHSDARGVIDHIFSAGERNPSAQYELQWGRGR